MIKISIIIPVYNVEQYLSRCIQSIINQNYKNLEIILIDDGSTDNSFSICENFSKIDNRIISIKKENEGVSRTRNLGISISTGDYIMFVDSDDFLSPELFDNINNINNLSEYDFIMWGINLFDGYKVYGKCFIENPKLDINSFTSFPEWFNSPFTKLINKNFLIKNNILFPNDIKLAEDMYFSYLCYFNSKNYLFISKPLYFYDTSRINSTCNNITKDKIFDEIKAISLLDFNNNIMSNITIRNSINERKISCKLKFFHSIKDNNDIIYFKKLYPKITIFRYLNIKNKILYLCIKLKLTFFITILLEWKNK